MNIEGVFRKEGSLLIWVYGLRVTGYGLRVAGYGLRVTGYGFAMVAPQRGTGHRGTLTPLYPLYVTTPLPDT